MTRGRSTPRPGRRRLALLFGLAMISARVVSIAGQAPARGPRIIAITGATLIDGTGSAPVGNAVIVIEGTKIKSIGAAGRVQVPQGARVIDGTGKFVIPGLFDAHTHWRGWSGELFLNHGVTSILDLGNPTDWILAAKDAENGGRLPGPRIFTSAGGIDKARPAGASAFGGATAAPYMHNVDGPNSARAVARSILEKGADALKIFADLTPEEYRAITEEAHKVDTPVIGHSSDLYASVNGGMDAVTHLWGVGITLMSPENKKKYEQNKIASPYAWMEPDKMDALVAFLVKHGTYLNVCLVNEHTGVIPQRREFEQADYDLLMNPNLRYVPLTETLSVLTFWHKLRAYSASLGSFPYVENVDAATLDEFKRGYKNAQEFTRRFARAGGKIFAGTDAGGSASLPGESLHQELRLLVDAGLTPMQAIESATRIPAEMIHKDYKLGTLAAGKLADLVVLDADPLADIRNISKIRNVIKNGDVLDTTYHRTYYTPYAELEAVGLSSSSAPKPELTEAFGRTLNQNSQVIHDGSPFELVVKGVNLHTTSLVYLNGQPLETTFVSRGELHAKVPTERIPEAGSYAVTVVTPWPGGGVSNLKTLAVK
jgi:imidazolonepropionase-like amidohydrolase